VIDAHLHVWDLSRDHYPWIPQGSDLDRSFLPDEAAHELARAGVDEAVVVQANDTLADTAFMLDSCSRVDALVGVVGWVELDNVDEAVAQLEQHVRHPAFRGVRHLVHDDPRDEFLDMPPVRASLRAVATHGLTFDVPDAWPRHLFATAQLAQDLPSLTVVVDHLGKPPRGTPDLPDWEKALRSVAASQNAVAKVSGLQVAGQPFTVDALRPVLDIALDAFGADRLMYGGDWPMTVPDGGYQPHFQVVSRLVGELSPDEQSAIMSDTARRVYRLQRT
jgi:L-fuconolactonase